MDVPAPDAESLMRSRYTAFVLGRTAYLLATWLPDNRPGQLEAEQGTQWLGLEVRDHSQPDADHAEVEFVARYRINGRAERLHERSRFVRLEDGAMSRWLYVDGDMLLAEPCASTPSCSTATVCWWTVSRSPWACCATCWRSVAGA